jgi:branched-subunit amino acid ABC-type transport system permease component
MLDFLQNTLDGIMVGSGYALLALGFTLVFGVMRRLNLSYGPSVMVGVFTGAWFHLHGAGLPAVAAATVAGTVIAGIYVDRLCFWAIRQRSAVTAVVSSFVVWMQLEEAVILAFPERTYPFPPLTRLPPMELGPFFFRAEHVTMFVAATSLMAGVAALLYRTRFGLALRAVAQDAHAARYMGIQVDAIGLRVAITAALIGGLAGFLIAGTDQQVIPKFGLWVTYKGLIAMMLGGMGSMPGAILGGLLLGVAEIQFQWYLGAQFRDLGAYFLLFAFLVFRPGGLLGQAIVRRKLAGFRRV